MRLSLTPCVPITSVFAFQLAVSVPLRSCSPASPPMIVEHPHCMSSVCAHPMHLASRGWLRRRLSSRRPLRVEAPWMGSGNESIVWRTVTSVALHPGPGINVSIRPLFQTTSPAQDHIFKHQLFLVQVDISSFIKAFSVPPPPSNLIELYEQRLQPPSCTYAQSFLLQL
jgi:hypothetical protein